MIPISMESAQIWQCSKQIFVIKNQSDCHTTKSVPISLIWVSIELFHQYKGARIIFKFTCPWCKDAGQVTISEQYFMAPNWSLHLCINSTIQLIPISVKLVQIWWCEDQILLGKKSAQNVLEQCLHLLMDPYMLSIYIRKYCPKIWWCSNQNIMMNNNNLVTAPPNLRRVH